jgi:hypothetical protein
MKPRLLLVFLFFGGAAALLAMPAAAQDDASDAADGFRLSDVKWQRRVLVLFAPSADDAAYRQQLRLFRTAPDSAFAERDLMLLDVPAEGSPRRRTWETKDAARDLSDEASGRLRKRFDVPAGSFALVLVGKDGTEKRRDEAPVPPEAIFAEIDAMPMRQREMQQQSDGGR